MLVVYDMSTWCLQVSAEKKAVGSTAGMGTSVETSQLLAYRSTDIVPGRMDNMETAILNKDFETFARLTMQVWQSQRIESALCSCLLSFLVRLC